MAATRVRNTFIELVSEPPLDGKLRRARSDQSCMHSEDCGLCLNSWESEDIEIPPMPQLCWTRTIDGYEPADPWSVPPEMVGPAHLAGDFWDASMETQIACGLGPQSADQWHTQMAANDEVMLLPIFMALEPLQAMEDPSWWTSGFGWGAPPPKSLSPSLPTVIAPPPPALKRAFSVTSQVYRVSWPVSDEVLESDDLEATSPSFPLSFSRDLQFQLVLQPASSSEADTDASFKVTGGKGRVLLRCLDTLDGTANPAMSFRLAVGATRGGREPPRGPVRHNFCDGASCGLPGSEELWNFAEHVDSEKHSFMVSLEVLAGRQAKAGS